MMNILLLEIGDEVIVNGKRGEVVAFHEIVLNKRSCLGTSNYPPGIYRNPALARIKMENGKVVDVYFNNLEAVDFKKYNERIRAIGYCEKRFVRKLPETLFCERDKVQVRSEFLEEAHKLMKEVVDGHRYRKPQMLRFGFDFGEEPKSDLDVFFILSINYCLDSDSYVYNVSDSQDNFHWHIALKERSLGLLERGEIWRTYHRK